MRHEPGLIVPPIYTPIPPAIHPRYAAVEAHTTAWAEAFQVGSDELRARLLRHSIGTFAARILPEGQEPVVSLLADFVLWLFAVDDGFCEEGALGRRPGELAAVLHRLLRVAQNPEAPMLLDDPLADGLRDLTRRVSRHGTAVQAAAWCNALREYFFSVVWEASHRREGTVPCLNDYTLMRLYDGATTVVYPLLEMGHGYELPTHERDQPYVRAATEMASFIITWDNDIFSHHKESRGDGYYLNVLRVLQEERGLTPEQALDTAINQRDRVMCLFMGLQESVVGQASPQLRQYFQGIGSFIRGSQDWGVSSQRYTTPEDPASLPTHFRPTPVVDSCEPLEIPAVSWWWGLLPEPLRRRPSPRMPMTALLAPTP
ncbi:terpene synthase [Streptomyces sp. BR123]|uniref:selina-4(15),7(11)-diene synthase n=1 Tax=Streptomyces sp. BR123 TaxID=2749828 RepID=UPI0015C4129E|nr:selina-4(15),7(11)-diene synthase [Streptomyces sp. BR123]NXY93806.1 terpene synthase [Streptomyces sp. BR123]